jgi:hypothetical protein
MSTTEQVMTTDEFVEEYLEHYGVKGMKWGVRKQRDDGSPRRKLTPNQKKAIVGGVVAVGAITAMVVLGKQGKLPVDQIVNAGRALKSSPRSTIDPAVVKKRTADGEAAVKRMAEQAAFKKIVAEMDADFARAHKEQTEFMLKTAPGYNPRSNEFTPSYERDRLRG